MIVNKHTTDEPTPVSYIPNQVSPRNPSAKSESTPRKAWNINPAPQEKNCMSFKAIVEEQQIQKREEIKLKEASGHCPSRSNGSFHRRHHHQPRRSPHNVRRYPAHRGRTSSYSTSPKKKDKKQQVRQKGSYPSNSSYYEGNHNYTQQMMKEDYLYSCSQMYSYFQPPHSPDSIIDDDLSVEERARYVGLDCEMVGIGPGGFKSALARVGIVNWDGNVILDTFVKVSEPVTDFRTFVSGIREENLRSEKAMDITECRALVKSILRGKILIGHALKNDLQALTISHPWYDIRDTAKYAPYLTSNTLKKCLNSALESDCSSTSSSSSSSSFSSQSSLIWKSQLRPRRLKELAEEILGIQIQVEGKEHSPVEDARAALALYKLASRKWEKVMEYKVNKTKQIEMKRTSLDEERV